MTFIISEVGCNHDGDLSKAVALTRAAAEAGVDAVKFQMFRAGENAMLKPLELSLGQLEYLKDVCKQQNVEFICTAFDLVTCQLVAEMAPRRMKIGSGQVKNVEFVSAVGRCGLPVIISNGMCTDADLETALKLLPEDVTILSCVSMYPTPSNAITLCDMARLRRKFGVKVGFSDHSGSVWPSIAAAAVGADVIECHVTLDKSSPGPDHSSSIEVGELKHWVSEIRHCATVAA